MKPLFVYDSINKGSNVSQNVEIIASKSVLYKAKATLLWRRHCHLHEPMKISNSIYNSSIDVLLYILQNMITEFREISLNFFIHCGFGIAVLLDNTGQSWDSMDHTQLFAQSTFWPVPICLGTKCGKRLGTDNGQQSPFGSVLSNRSTCQEAIYQRLRINVKKWKEM